MKKSTRVIENAQTDMTPMLDVVFILLIFFVVTTTFSRSYSLDIERPKPSLASPSEAENLQIRIDEQDRIWLRGRVISAQQLAANIAKESATCLALCYLHRVETQATVRIAVNPAFS